MRIIFLIIWTLFVSGSVLAQNRILVVDELRLNGTSLNEVQSVVAPNGNALVTAQAVVNYVASQGGGGSGYSVYDTTFTSTGNDFSVSGWTSILGANNEVRMDVVLQSGASSDAQISLPPAASYPGKTIVISAYNESLNTISVFGAGNNSPAFSLSNAQAVTLVSMKYSNSPAWVALLSSSGGLSDGDKGDVSVSGSGSEITLNSNVAGYEELENAADIDSDTVRFLRYAEYNSDTAFSGQTIFIDTVGAYAGAYAFFHVDASSEPTLFGADPIIKTGRFEPDTLNIYHFLWSNAGGYMLAIQSTQAGQPSSTNQQPGDTVLTFVATNMTTNGNYQYLASGASYSESYAVTTDSLVGNFSVEIDVSNINFEHAMFGLSLTPANVRWNDPTNPWRVMIFLSSVNDATVVGENGALGTIDNSVTATYQSGDALRFERVSGVVRAYFNSTEIHNFGTITDVLYFNMSNFTPRSVRLNNNFTGFSTQN